MCVLITVKEFYCFFYYSKSLYYNIMDKIVDIYRYYSIENKKGTTFNSALTSKMLC